MSQEQYENPREQPTDILAGYNIPDQKIYITNLTGIQLKCLIDMLNLVKIASNIHGDNSKPLDDMIINLEQKFLTMVELQ